MRGDQSLFANYETTKKRLEVLQDKDFEYQEFPENDVTFGWEIVNLAGAEFATRTAFCIPKRSKGKGVERSIAEPSEDRSETFDFDRESARELSMQLAGLQKGPKKSIRKRKDFSSGASQGFKRSVLSIRYSNHLQSIQKKPKAKPATKRPKTIATGSTFPVQKANIDFGKPVYSTNLIF
ncbi:hypothetical protein OCU04_010464 [Sclerotinia nivalis]|uniref:Uncharacterized protein n=1 Tax=Sclerotinia nivalis TaxID=352851 RepID=A0A9X0AI64_9HELO|nr:hypothetical protein OCU04_010464 [Sclerotinia nivalis]